jgi:hypothetical protein
MPLAVTAEPSILKRRGRKRRNKEGEKRRDTKAFFTAFM